MGKESKPRKKKLSMKTRLIIILVMLVLVNLIFYVGFDNSDDSIDEDKIEQESKIILDEFSKEQQFFKFNPPTP
ncbi:MAG: hypothetical protein NPMRTHETA2_160006 [Nitrosopumilales archaeon]|nr:MAG: hypothetical protein NPMRTHETA2_160006 [Nitrosopumilales archaeon]MCH7647597.1 hypothetical protein [Nitrososphaerota archaeon]